MSGIPFGFGEGMVRLALTSSLLGLVIMISYLRKLGIGRDSATAALRGTVQIMLLASIFVLVFDSELWYIIVWGIFAVMVHFAGWTSSRRAREVPGSYSIAVRSITLGSSTSIVVLALTGLMPMAPQFVIPLAGMCFGNSMTVCTLTLNRISGELRAHKSRIESALALGARSDQAADPYLKTSMRSALMPSIDSLRTLGIIFIPGTMTGLLMAGASPLVAAVYQVAVYFMIMGAGMVTAMMAAKLSVERLFTEAHQLIDIPEP